MPDEVVADATVDPEAPSQEGVSESTEAKVEAPVAAPAVTQADLQAGFTALGDSLKESFAGIGESLRAASAPAPTAAAAPVIEDVSDAAIEEAIRNEQPVAPLLDKRARAHAQRATAELRAEVDQLRTVGLTSMQALAGETVKNRKHYVTYKKEIDTAIEGLTPALRSNPEAHIWMYDQVVGRHANEIEERVKIEAVRQAREASPAPEPSGASGRVVGASNAATKPEDVLSPEALAQVAEWGGAEKCAKLFGYVDRAGVVDTGAFLANQAATPWTGPRKVQ